MPPSKCHKIVHTFDVTGIATPTWGNIFECCLKVQSSKLERLFCYISVKRAIRALSFELGKSFRKCHPRGIGYKNLFLFYLEIRLGTALISQTSTRKRISTRRTSTLYETSSTLNLYTHQCLIITSMLDTSTYLIITSMLDTSTSPSPK